MEGLPSTDGENAPAVDDSTDRLVTEMFEDSSGIVGENVIARNIRELNDKATPIEEVDIKTDLL